jgi:uncharacterized protein YprB with RNaseH-like and TPR domain
LVQAPSLQYNVGMSDLTQKLRRLGVSKGTQELVSPPPASAPALHDDALPPGVEIETPFGVCFYIEQRYPLDHVHGHSSLAKLLVHDRTAAAQMTTGAREAPASHTEELDLSRALFIDTETTGLGWGAGVLAFLIGAGYYQADHFVLRQYFLRDPAEETAALHHLADWSEDFGGLVSFNGRGFDVPLLQTRFVLSRLRPAILNMPHLDLLPPARRVWRGRFESCALGTLEQHVLGVQRSQDDVMSWLIPELYRQYLRGGDNGEMRQVLYHNEVDILSMVTLAERLCVLLADPLADKVDARERAALARWFEALDQPEHAEATYRATLEGWLPLETQHVCLRNLSALLKRQNRRAEAVPLWIQWAMQDESRIKAHVELAKFYEWHEIDLEKALAWTKQASDVIARWPRGQPRDAAQEEVDYRRARLEQKLSGKRMR